MPLVTRDLVPAFLEFWERAASRSQAEREALWLDYVDRYPEVINDVTRSGVTEIDPAPALAKYPALLSLIKSNAPLATGWLQEAADTVMPLLDAAHLDVPCLSIVGLARSNGWVTTIDEVPTLFIAVEQLPDPDSARILVTHEMSHACQLGLDDPWPENGPIGQDLFAEGFASRLTAELMPEYSLAKHLWFGDGYDGWLAECAPLLPQARAEIRDNVRAQDEQTSRRFFALNARNDDLPDRIGYLVGVHLLGQLRLTYSWPELARWSPGRALDEVTRVLDG